MQRLLLIFVLVWGCSSSSPPQVLPDDVAAVQPVTEVASKPTEATPSTTQPQTPVEPMPPAVLVLVPLMQGAPALADVVGDGLLCGLRQFRPPLSEDRSASLPKVLVGGYEVRKGDRGCGGFPTLPLKTPPGMCVGLVAGPEVGWIKPRTLAQLPDGRWLVVDMGSWSKPKGAVWLREHDGSWRKILDKHLPLHGLALGPDGLVYIGERARILRFDPLASNPSDTVEEIIADLPNEGRHPLKHFIFDLKGDLLINIGSSSDHCERGKIQPDGNTPCPEVEGDTPYASVRHYSLDGPNKTPTRWTTFARGLRNSMALAVHPTSGLILQAENARDFKPDDLPFEELNILPGGDTHHGWPYCHGMRDKSPEWARWSALDCTKYVEPALLMPAHSAPLGMLYYFGAMFPDLRGKLIVSWHGYRPNGHRIVAYDTDPQGVPLREPNPPDGNPMGFPTLLVDGWSAAPGLHPQGNPVALAVANDGSIWTTEDKNKTLLRLARPTPQLNEGLPPRFVSCADLPTFAPPLDPQNPSTWPTQALTEALAAASKTPEQAATFAAFADLYTRALEPQCVNCHAYPPGEPLRAAALWIQMGLVRPGLPDESDLYVRLVSPQSPGRMPPAPASMLPDADAALLRAWIEQLRLAPLESP